MQLRAQSPALRARSRADASPCTPLPCLCTMVGASPQSMCVCVCVCACAVLCWRCPTAACPCYPTTAPASAACMTVPTFPLMAWRASLSLFLHQSSAQAWACPLQMCTTLKLWTRGCSGRFCAHRGGRTAGRRHRCAAARGVRPLMNAGRECVCRACLCACACLWVLDQRKCPAGLHHSGPCVGHSATRRKLVQHLLLSFALGGKVGPATRGCKLRLKPWLGTVGGWPASGHGPAENRHAWYAHSGQGAVCAQLAGCYVRTVGRVHRLDRRQHSHVTCARPCMRCWPCFLSSTCDSGVEPLFGRKCGCGGAVAGHVAGELWLLGSSARGCGVDAVAGHAAVRQWHLGSSAHGCGVDAVAGCRACAS